MYASNEDEFNREHDDWVFLRQSLPIASSVHGAMNLVDHEQTISSSSTSTSSSESSLSTSERSDSVSSIEIEQDKNEEPVLTSQANDLVVEGELKEQGLSSEIPIKQVSEGETSPVINEYELPHSACDSSQETITSTSHLRRRTGANVQETGDQYVPTIEHGSRSARSSNQHPRKRNVLLIYGILVLLLALPIVLCRFATSQRHVLDKITENLQQTNQRLDQIKNVPIEDLEQKLTKQLEEKFQGILKQKTIEHNLEKSSLVSQINELYHIVYITQLNLTNTIHQLSSENERLQKQVIGLEERQHIMEEQQAKINTTCSKNTDETKATVSPLENIISNVIKQTTSITTNTSENLAGFFEQLSTKISDFVDNRHEYVEETKQKLNNFAKSKTAEKVKKTIRRSVENFSSSIHQAQTSYATWMRSRAEQREQARMDSKEFEDNGKSTRRPWRWTFQRSHDREKLRHQIPVTKKHTSHKEYVCHPNYDFPVNQLCTMKNWMDKLFQS